jgi:hypothetical protein
VLPGATLNAITLERRPLTGAVTSHGKSKLLGHFGAQRLPIGLGIFLGIPAEFEDGNENGEGESAQQHDKYAADVLDSQGIRLRLLVLLVPTAYLAGVLPPLVVQDLDGSLLLQLENRQRDFITPDASLRCCDAVAFE